MKGNFEYLLGSASSCDISIRRIGISDKHAQLKRRGDRLFIKDLKSAQGVFVNETKIPQNKWIEITRFDVVKLATLELDIGASLFFGRKRLSIDTTNLEFSTKEGRTLCKGTHLRAEPGTVTAIIGPSGCGKSVFLSLLCGIYKPNKGSVYLGNGNIDLHKEKASIGEFIGYVPQAEILIPELTVEESLHYRLRLRYLDMGLATRERLIEEVCEKIGFTGERLKRILKTRIGKPEEKGAVLSGGERRRISIAHELIIQPLVLFLDEPTSGLSSFDADGICELLCNLAKNDGITIVTTIHQPSKEAFSKFDNLLVMGHGGNSMYLGKINDIPLHFPEIVTQKGNWSEEILAAVQSERLTGTKHKNDLNNGFEPFSKKEQKVGKKSETNISKKQFNFFSQFKILFGRNLCVFKRDRGNLLFTWLQVPIIALLIFAGFLKSETNHRSDDIFVRTIYGFHNQDESIKSNLNTPDQLRESLKTAKTENGYISVPRAHQRATIYYVLALTAIWFGLLGSSKEIVIDKSIIQKEYRGGINLSSVYFSKFSLQSLITFIQILLILLFINYTLLNLSNPALLSLFFIMCITSASAISVGMLLSSIASTYRSVLTMIPLIMIPQVLFGGLLCKTDTTIFSKYLSYLTNSRWAFQESIKIDPSALSLVLATRSPEEMSESTIGLGALMSELVQVYETGIYHLFFSQPHEANLPILVTITSTIILSLLSILILKIKLERKSN